jgi:hypothetical protein
MAIVFFIPLIATSCLLTVSYPFRTIPENLLAFCNYCLAQIVLLSISLSETFGISTKSFLLGQLGVTTLATLTWILRGKPKVFCPTQFVERFKGPNQKLIWLVTGLAAAALVLFAINVEFFRLLPSMTKDAHAYHLPRAYYWLQQGSLHYLPYSDFRWKEFAPNSSIILMWLMAVGVGYEWMHIPQIIGAAMIALGVYRLTTLCGGNRLAAVCASIICVGFPATIYQMGTSGNDLLVGGLVVSSIVFFAQVFQPCQDASAIRRASVQTAISVGLGVGTKLTFVLVFPGMLLFAVGSLFVLGWSIWWSRVRRVVIVGAIACAALGSYNYVQNYVDHGSLTFSKEANDIMGKFPPSTAAQRVVLLVHQTLSWHGIEKNPDNLLPALQRKVILLVDQQFGLGLDKVQGFNDSHLLTEFTADENLAGFGIFGFLILLASPFIGLLQLYQFVKTKNFVKLLQSGLILIGLSALMLLFIYTPAWTPASLRYNIHFIPILVASAICLDFFPGWLRNILYVLVSIFSLWVMYYCIVAESSRASLFAAAREGKRPLHFHLDGRWLPQIDVLRSSVPAGAKIGYSGRLDSWAFVLPRELPAYQFVLLKPEDIQSALMSGRVAAVLTELPDTYETQVLPLPGTMLSPKQSLFVLHPESVLKKNLAAYGMGLTPDGSSLTLSARAIEAFSHIHQVYPQGLDYLKIFLPVSPLRTNQNTERIRVEIPLVPPFPTDLITSVTCNSHEVEYLIKDGMLTFELGPNVLVDEASVQLVLVKFSATTPAMLEGDRKFLDAVSFGAPWVISTVPM